MGWLQDQQKRIEDEKREKERVKLQEEQRINQRHEDAGNQLESFYRTKLQELIGSELKYGPLTFQFDRPTQMRAYSGEKEIFLLSFWYCEEEEFEGDCKVGNGKYYLRKEIYYKEEWVDSEGNVKKSVHNNGHLNEKTLAEYILFLMKK